MIWLLPPRHWQLSPHECSMLDLGCGSVGEDFETEAAGARSAEFGEENSPPAAELELASALKIVAKVPTSADLMCESALPSKWRLPSLGNWTRALGRPPSARRDRCG